MGRGVAPRWVIRKVAPAKSHNRPRMARDTTWWRVLSNRLRELWLVGALPTRRPHLPQQPEQIERLRTHLRRMATEAQTEEGRAEIWEMATQTHGELELQVLKDVHRKALTVLDKLHKRDRTASRKSDRGVRRERLPKEQRACCIASRSRAQSGAQGMRRKERRPTRQMQRNWPRAGHVFGGSTLKSCKRQTGRGRPQTVAWAGPRRCWT